MSHPQARPEDHRRRWDSDEIERRMRERDEEARQQELEDEKPRKKAKKELLRAREERVDLESRVGKSVIITSTTPLNQAGGFYCEVCDCVIKDSINYLDHINGKKHQKNMGFSMKTERSTVDQVKARFARNKEKMEEKKQEYDFEEKMKELREEEEKYREYKREKKQEKKRKAEIQDSGEDGDGMDPDMAAMMGFSGFGTSKK
ncbi:zinc finger matrin-type protein 2-like [Paramacrobiotus metropolitanus]|uniref:zinc finger matrin-type protein 2-like n=1 Tax=Paramacrobiotus metropolitanus TaxID=2943436 RepID=UPI0024460D05|nr:zinc finger matrin-type protein 2-like [Paramacrobiotus metropolitanus]